MSSTDRPEQTADDGVPGDGKSACVALVTAVPAIHRPHGLDRQMSRADFVTQLIATAAHVPQTRNLRRATPADAQAAYGARLHQAPSGGLPARRVI